MKPNTPLLKPLKPELYKLGLINSIISPLLFVSIKQDAKIAVGFIVITINFYLIARSCYYLSLIGKLRRTEATEVQVLFCENRFLNAGNSPDRDVLAFFSKNPNLNTREEMAVSEYDSLVLSFFHVPSELLKSGALKRCRISQNRKGHFLIELAPELIAVGKLTSRKLSPSSHRA